MSRDDVTDRVGEITYPASPVRGTEDTAISMGRVQAPVAGLPAAGAHAATLTNPEPVGVASVEFLDGLSA